MRAKLVIALVLAVLWASVSGAAAAGDESGFRPLFDGKSLQGWKLVNPRGDGYGVKEGVIYCARGGGGNLFTEREYSDFVLRFEFKLEAGSNNGIGIRAPLEGRSSVYGMEIQILEEGAARAGKWGDLHSTQFHGSIYNVLPARTGFLKTPGEWNSQEIVAQGRHIKVILNGECILEADLNQVTDRETLAKHPGLLRDRGHIGLLGHNDYVEFRNLRVKELPQVERDNTPPDGFVALFNGRNLRGWKGLLARPYDSPLRRLSLAPAERTARQRRADRNMREHWKVTQGQMVFDGKGRNLCTAGEYGDFELCLDWKLPAGGDSGVHLRGCPGVQIRDPRPQPARPGGGAGSGGLQPNRIHPSSPLMVADRPGGEWNRFRILMIGEKVHVFLNGELVVNATTLENDWDRERPIFPLGPIELQSGGNPVAFKNIYIRELSH